MAEVFEGHLAVALDALQLELKSENNSLVETRLWIDGFVEMAPTIFSGDMKVYVQQANDAFTYFKTVEVGKEKSWHVNYTNRMRGRVDTKLYKKNDNHYQDHRDHRNVLQEFMNEQVQPLAFKARAIDQSVKSMINYLEKEAKELSDAKKHTHDFDGF